MAARARRSQPTRRAAPRPASGATWQDTKRELERFYRDLLPTAWDEARRLGVRGGGELGFAEYADLAAIGYRRGRLTLSRFNSIMRLVYKGAFRTHDRAGADRALVVWEGVIAERRRAQKLTAAKRPRPARQIVKDAQLRELVASLKERNVKEGNWVGMIQRSLLLAKENVVISDHALRKRLIGLRLKKKKSGT